MLVCLTLDVAGPAAVTVHVVSTRRCVGPGAGDRSCRHGLVEAQLCLALRETTSFVQRLHEYGKDDGHCEELQAKHMKCPLGSCTPVLA